VGGTARGLTHYALPERAPWSPQGFDPDASLLQRPDPTQMLHVSSGPM
jgi:hypothetical protein